MRASSVLHHAEIVWGCNKLHLHLKEEFTSLYGDTRPLLEPTVWSDILEDVTKGKHPARELGLYVPPSCNLSLVLTAIARHWENIVDANISWIDVNNGEINWNDLQAWYTSLTSQPGWSAQEMKTKVQDNNGVKVTDNRGRSVVIHLLHTRVLSYNKQQVNDDVPGLLLHTDWIQALTGYMPSEKSINMLDV